MTVSFRNTPTDTRSIKLVTWRAVIKSYRYGRISPFTEPGTSNYVRGSPTTVPYEVRIMFREAACGIYQLFAFAFPLY